MVIAMGREDIVSSLFFMGACLHVHRTTHMVCVCIGVYVCMRSVHTVHTH
jgi:hypothetical protein